MGRFGIGVDRVKAVLRLQQEEESRKKEGDRWDDSITKLLWSVVRESDATTGRRPRQRGAIAAPGEDKGTLMETKFVVTPDEVEAKEVLDLLEKMSSKKAVVHRTAAAKEAAVPYSETPVEGAAMQPNRRWKFVFKDTADESIFAVRDTDGVFKEVAGGEDKRPKTWGRRKL